MCINFIKICLKLLTLILRVTHESSLPAKFMSQKLSVIASFICNLERHINFVSTAYQCEHMSICVTAL